LTDLTRLITTLIFIDKPSQDIAGQEKLERLVNITKDIQKGAHMLNPELIYLLIVMIVSP